VEVEVGKDIYTTSKYDFLDVVSRKYFAEYREPRVEAVMFLIDIR